MNSRNRVEEWIETIVHLAELIGQLRSDNEPITKEAIQDADSELLGAAQLILRQVHNGSEQSVGEATAFFQLLLNKLHSASGDADVFAPFATAVRFVLPAWNAILLLTDLIVHPDAEGVNKSIEQRMRLIAEEPFRWDKRVVDTDGVIYTQVVLLDRSASNTSLQYCSAWAVDGTTPVDRADVEAHHELIQAYVSKHGSTIRLSGHQLRHPRISDPGRELREKSGAQAAGVTGLVTCDTVVHTTGLRNLNLRGDKTPKDDIPFIEEVVVEGLSRVQAANVGPASKLLAQMSDPSRRSKRLQTVSVMHFMEGIDVPRSREGRVVTRATSHAGAVVHLFVVRVGEPLAPRDTDSYGFRAGLQNVLQRLCAHYLWEQMSEQARQVELAKQGAERQQVRLLDSLKKMDQHIEELEQQTRSWRELIAETLYDEVCKWVELGRLLYSERGQKDIKDVFPNDATPICRHDGWDESHVYALACLAAYQYLANHLKSWDGPNGSVKKLWQHMLVEHGASLFDRSIAARLFVSEVSGAKHDRGFTLIDTSRGISAAREAERWNDALKTWGETTDVARRQEMLSVSFLRFLLGDSQWAKLGNHASVVLGEASVGRRRNDDVVPMPTRSKMSIDGLLRLRYEGETPVDVWERDPSRESTVNVIGVDSSHRALIVMIDLGRSAAALFENLVRLSQSDKAITPSRGMGTRALADAIGARETLLNGAWRGSENARPQDEIAIVVGSPRGIASDADVGSDETLGEVGGGVKTEEPLYGDDQRQAILTYRRTELGANLSLVEVQKHARDYLQAVLGPRNTVPERRAVGPPHESVRPLALVELGRFVTLRGQEYLKDSSLVFWYFIENNAV
jgi:hypothetical protein